MSQKIRATSASDAHGITWNVEASGSATMSDSWIQPNPSIDEPSSPSPREGALELLRGDRERLQEAGHVGEPQADEADPALLDRSQDVFGLGR